jgi:hypothetical protein
MPISYEEVEFVPYEIALALKELGFDEPCFTYYKNDQLSDVLELVKNSEMENVNNEVDDYISAPTFSQAFRFFREKYFKMCFVYYDVEYRFCFCIGYNDKTKGFKTYEEAELACLNKLIELVKNK